MNTPTANQERDEVLFAFHQECTNPTAQEIINWVNRYPEYADDIRSHAALMKDAAARESLPTADLSPEMISRAQSRVMDALHRARVNCGVEAGASVMTFEQVMAKTNTNVPDLARKLNIARSVLASLINGRMLAPVGDRLRSELTNIWRISQEQFDQAVRRALAAPSVSHAKSEGTPAVIPRSYAEVVHASSMPDARKRYWLGED